MITKGMQDWGRRVAAAIVTPFAASGITPNMLTVIGLLLSLFTAGVIATGHVSLGGILLLFAGIFDTFDGALARVTGKASTFGAFFDSTLDRIAEAGIGLGLLLYYTSRQDVRGATLLYLVIIGSLMISYARARAEGLELECKVGLMARPERVIILGIGLILGPTVTLWVLGLLAVTTWFTVIQRIAHIWRVSGVSGDHVTQTAEPAAPRVSPFKRKAI